MLKIFDNYYLDASSVCYMLKKAHVKGDGMEECDVCTYHTRLEEALAEAVRRGLREGVASGELTEWEQLCGELRRLKHEVQGLLESISPADDALDLTLKNGNNCACLRCRVVRLGDLGERKKRPHLVENQISKSLKELFK